MKKLNYLSLATVLALSLGSPAMAGPGHDHGASGHSHGAESPQDARAHEGHTSGKAGDFASTKDALAALKAALAEADAATQNDNLEAIHEIYPRIEGSAAYIHDYANPASEGLADRFHVSVDQMMALVAEMHDTSHTLDKEATARLLKKANGSVMLVENYLPASDRAGSAAGAPANAPTENNHGHDHSDGSHSH